MMKIAFFGTGEFAGKILTALLNNTDYSVDLVITQPDKKVGRKQIIEESPVKIIAKQHKLKIIQPESLKQNFDLSILNEIDLNVVCQYGLIIPEAVLNIPANKSLNIHTSLLPKYRGASPIQTALINGEKITGITIMLMDKKMDHGPILSQTKISIEPDDTCPLVSEKLATMAIPQLLNTVKKWLAKQIEPQIQDETQATFCKIFTRDDGRINFTNNSESIYNQYRGLQPWPGIWTTIDDKRIKLTKITKTAAKNLKPGEILISGNHIYAGCGQNSTIEILSAQLEGRNNLPAAEFLNGMRDINEKILQ
ncbi:MAG: methionyl-tRNA formyltransferase [Candidatus Magasanikbacteria bacterium CG10_big_fil_rev_8_21_14_0_10_36_32]|uniref:Methionyl-tRNA formyltransferase n=1 Tax=Candidatus Magasanikbacteria bacterium CG10_big_fil_rev_8_21_14_0_10_36_32 TaxID=1974646 RepID=A0A2M6W7H6_9BACT|nr:MAG: methionyl-tRNA formyltransferase [Candidatus Magasanikbacteria bacterium CG10_big_fil_rev_8_21_14_0_10_36_32]